MEQNNQEVNHHIEEYLDYYFGLSYPPGFAILLKGEWGSGKTWLINQYREKPEYKNKKILYVSLYGMTSFAEIENAFFQQLYPIRSSKAFAVTEQIFQGFIKASLRIDLNQDGKDDTVSLQIPQINLPKSLKDIEEIILIFDDLERCQIDISNILGYINSFVEHKKSKVVILANEDELLKQENDSTQIKYQNIKEKLINKTFGVSPDLNSALESFVAKIANPNLKTFLSNNVDLIQKIYSLAEYENLRVLQHIIIDFERLYAKLPEKAQNKSKFIQEILQRLIAFSIEIKKGSLLPKDILKLEKEYAKKFREDFGYTIDNIPGQIKDSIVVNESNKINDILKSDLRNILNRYSLLNIHRPFPNLIWWQNFFDRGEINKQQLESLLTKHKLFQNENTPNWIRLWWFSNLQDEELESLIEKVELEYASHQFKTLEEVKHITGIFLKLSDVGLYERSKRNILQQAKLYIDWLKNNNLIDINLQWFSTPSFEYRVNPNNGLGFQQKDSDEFKELCAYIDKVRATVKLEMMPQLAEDLLATMQNDQFKFFRMVCLHVTPGSKKVDEWDQIYFEVPLFKYITPEQFLENLLRIPSQDWERIFMGLENRYQSININKKLIGEFNWINSICSLLLLEAERRKNKISGYNFKSYTEYYFSKILESILESLKQQILEILNYLLSNPIIFRFSTQYIISDDSLIVTFDNWYCDLTN